MLPPGTKNLPYAKRNYNQEMDEWMKGGRERERSLMTMFVGLTPAIFENLKNYLVFLFKLTRASFLNYIKKTPNKQTYMFSFYLYKYK